MPAFPLPPRATAAALVLLAGVLLMPSLSWPLRAATRAADYPRLSANTAASEALEVRKLLHGPVDGLFVAPATGQVLAAAGDMLWKYSADGVLLDFIDEPPDMHASGIAFGPDQYVDWVFTGQREAKAYAPEVDGTALTRAQLHAELDRAGAVAFGHAQGRTWAWLWAEGRAWKLWLDPSITGSALWCGRRSAALSELGWHADCLDGYTPARPSLLEVEPESFARDTGEGPPRVQVAGFDRRRFHLEEGVGGQLLGATVGQVLKGMGYPGTTPQRYWFGDARVQLAVADQTLRFTAFVPKEDGGYQFFRNMRWWEPSRVLPGASPWFSVHLRGYMESAGELALLEYYRDDIGLYVVRPRGAGEVPAAQRQVPAWRPRFEGEPTGRRPVTAQLELEGGHRVRRWLRPPLPRPAVGATPALVVEPLQPDLHALPQAMTLHWGARQDRASRGVLRLALDHPALRAALAAPARPGAVRELVVRIAQLHERDPEVQLLLREGTRETPLPVAGVQVLEWPPFRALGGGRPGYREQLEATIVAAAAGGGHALERFLRQSALLAADAHYAGRFAPALAAGYARLVNASNLAGDFDASAQLVRHYLDVHPALAGHEDPSVAYNSGVVASQALAFAIHRPQERALVDAVMAQLVGPAFDPATESNTTLLYNLACHYALRGEVERMLEAVAAARARGKPAAQFMADADFAHWHGDARFLRALETAR